MTATREHPHGLKNIGRAWAVYYKAAYLGSYKTFDVALSVRKSAECKYSWLVKDAILAEFNRDVVYGIMPAPVRRSTRGDHNDSSS